MDINLTILGEMITFAILVWVMMKYIWPPLMNAIAERQKKIADGLEAAEQAKRDLEFAKTKATEQLHQAKAQATNIIDQAKQQGNSFIQDSKVNAQKERDKILAQAKLDIEHESNKVKYNLQQQSAELIVAATEKILQQKIDDATQKKLIDQLIVNI